MPMPTQCNCKRQKRNKNLPTRAFLPQFQGPRLWDIFLNLVPRRQAIKKLVTVTSNLGNLLHQGAMPSLGGGGKE